jgi:uncharacterized protein (TIRG00374 family)
MKNKAAFLLKLTVTISLLGYLFSKIDIEKIVTILLSANIKSLGLCLILILIQVIALTLRWKIIIQNMQVNISNLKFYDIFQINLVGSFFNQFLPSSIGGDAMRIWKIRGYGLTLREAINSILIDRISALFSLALIMLFCITGFSNLVTNIPIQTFFIISTLSIIVSPILIILFLKLSVNVINGRITQELALVINDFIWLFYKNKKNGVKIIFISLVMHLFTVLIFYEIADSIGENPFLLDFLVLIPPILLFSVLPISLAGWGVREIGMVALLAYGGISANNALAISIIFGLLTIISAIPGAIIWAFWSNKSPSNESQKCS